MLYPNPMKAKELSPIEMLMQNPEFMQQMQSEGGIPQPQAQPMQSPQEAPMPQGDGMPMVEGYLNDEDYGQDKYEENNPQPEKKLGLLGRIQQKPGGSRALLALGASLLTDQNFFSGLGKGAMAYQNVLDEEEEKLKPKTEYLGGGAFEMTYDPRTGQRTMKRTPVADFERENLGIKLTTQEKIAENRIAGQIDMNNADNESADKRLKRELEAAENEADEKLAFERWRVNRQIEADRELEEVKGGADAGKPPPAAIVKEINNAKSKVAVFDNTTSQIRDVIGILERGELPLGLVDNAKYKAQLVTGVGVSDAAIKYQQFQNLLETIRNAKLQANVGVQTDGDADRAMNEVLYGRGDPKAVAAALKIVMRNMIEIRDYHDTAAMDMEEQFGVKNSRRPQRRAAPQAPASGQTSSGVKWKIVN